MVLKRLSVVLMCWSIVSCDDFGHRNVGNGDSEVIDSPVHVSLWEILNPDGRDLRLNCVTEKIYGCVNFSISYQSEIQSNLITLFLTGIFKPQICLTALGPAAASIPLGSFANGEYPLQFVVNAQVSTFQLQVTDETYILSGPPTLWIQLERDTLGRIPLDAIWGYVGYGRYGEDGGPSPGAQIVIDSLYQAGAQPLALSDGDYGYFEVYSGRIKPWENHGNLLVVTFMMIYSGVEEDLELIVDWSGNKYGEFMDVALYTDKGSSYYSWIQP